MTTIAIKGKTFEESNQNLSLKERIVKAFTTYFEEYGTEIVCGMLMLSGNTSGILAYSMLRK